MPEAPLTPEALRKAAAELASARDADGALDRVARVVAEALLDQATHRTLAVSAAVVDARMADEKLSLDSAASATGKPLEVLRGGARNAAERALVAGLFARHLGATLERRDGVHALRETLPALDWLEFVGQYPPYTAARATLADEPRARLDELLRAAPVDAPTDAAAAAVRALRGVSEAPAAAAAVSAPAKTSPRAARRPEVSVACEVEGFERGAISRALTTVVPVGAISAALRLVFVHRRPATVTLDGDALRVVGHSEILGRTLGTWDVRFPLTDLVELRRETRYPALPAALSVFALAVGSIFGAKFVVEGARAAYFPLIGLGLGMLAGGIFFDWVLRALFPGVKGRTRLVIRGGDARGLVLTELPVDELDRLLDAIESPSERAPLVSGSTAVSAATVRDSVPAPDRHHAARG